MHPKIKLLNSNERKIVSMKDKNKINLKKSNQLFLTTFRKIPLAFYRINTYLHSEKGRSIQEEQNRLSVSVSVFAKT